MLVFMIMLVCCMISVYDDTCMLCVIVYDNACMLCVLLFMIMLVCCVCVCSNPVC